MRPWHKSNGQSARIWRVGQIYFGSTPPRRSFVRQFLISFLFRTLFFPPLILLLLIPR